MVVGFYCVDIFPRADSLESDANLSARLLGSGFSRCIWVDTENVGEAYLRWDTRWVWSVDDEHGLPTDTLSAC